MSPVKSTPFSNKRLGKELQYYTIFKHEILKKFPCHFEKFQKDETQCQWLNKEINRSKRKYRNYSKTTPYKQTDAKVEKLPKV